MNFLIRNLKTKTNLFFTLNNKWFFKIDSKSLPSEYKISYEKKKNNLIQPINTNEAEALMLRKLKNDLDKLIFIQNNNRLTSLYKGISQIIDFYHYKVKELKELEENPGGLPTKSKYLELFKILNCFQEFNQALILKKQDTVKLQQIFEYLIYIYKKIEEKEHQNKAIILENLIFLLEKIYKEFEYENYILYFKQKYDEKIDFNTFFYKELVKKSTHSIFMHLEFFPKSYIPFLKSIKSEYKNIKNIVSTPILHKKSIEKLIDLINKFKGKSNSKLKKIISDLELLIKKKMKILDLITNLNSLNVIYKLIIKYKIDSNNEICLLINKKLEKNFENIFKNSNIQNIIYFGILLCENSQYFSELTNKLYFENLKKSIKTLYHYLYFVTPMLNFSKKFIISEDFLIMFNEFIKVSQLLFLDSLDLVFLTKLYCKIKLKSVQAQDLKNSENLNKFQLYNKIIIKNYSHLSTLHKFIIISQSFGLNIQIKNMLYNDSKNELENCPDHLLGVVMSAIIFNSTSIQQISDFENIILVKIKEIKFDSLCYIFSGFIYNFKGSNSFLKKISDYIFEKILIENLKALEKKTLIHLHRAFYTIKHYYKQFYDENFEKNYNSFNQKFNKITYFMNYFETKNLSDFESILKELDVSYKKRQIIGINVVDYIIKNKIIVNFYKSGCYISENQLKSEFDWAEKLLNFEIKYIYKAIKMSNWLSLRTIKEKKDYVSRIININEKLEN